MLQFLPLEVPHAPSFRDPRKHFYRNSFLYHLKYILTGKVDKKKKNRLDVRIITEKSSRTMK